MNRNIWTLFTVLFVFLAFPALSQEVSGKVLDADTNEPLIGALIRNTTQNKGTTSDVDGSFVIDADNGDNILISYIGYTDQNLIVGQDDFSTIVLGIDQEAIDEVVVIGYGSVKKSEVTGAVSYVDSEVVDEIKPFNAQEALQGTSTGVSVTSQGGAPGGGFNIRIRGVGTNNNAQPLVIIDGYKGDINLLNPNDIESFTILKDAQAAIYGAQGANGVILITTKQGKKNQDVKVTYDGYYGTQNTSKKLNMLDPIEYGVLLNESYAAAGKDLPFTSVNDIPIGADWQNVLFENAPISSNSLNLTGGGEKSDFNLSGSYFDQKGIIGGSKTGFNRGTARGAYNVDISEKIKLNTNLIYTNLTRKSINDFGLGSVLFNAINTPPTFSVHDGNDFTLIPSTPGLGIEIINPIAQIANTYNSYNLSKVNGTVGADWELFNGFTLTGRYGFNKANAKGKVFNPVVNYGGKVFDVQRSSVSQNEQDYNDFTFDFYGTYEKSLNDDEHNFNLTVGTSLIKEYGSGLFATGYDVPNNSWDNADLSLATGTSDNIDNSSYTYDNRIGSQFGRLQYSFQDRYFLAGTLRRDVSSRFGKNNRAAWFPSITTGWNISDESFFSSKTIDLMKFRLSYGELGNDQIQPDLFNGTLNPIGGVYVINGNIVTVNAPGRIPNPDVKWEASKKFDVGMDFEFLDNKFNFSADYYNNKRNDLLLSDTPISGITGYAAPGSGLPTVNIGGIENSGFEFGLGFKNNPTKDIFYSVNYNLSTVKNNVTYVAGEGTFIETGSFGVGNPPPARMEEGQPIGYYYGFKTEGVFQNQEEIDNHAKQVLGGVAAKPGDLKYMDLNQDGVIDLNDRTNIGDYIAPVEMGLNFQLEYKNIDFLIYTYSALGNEVVRNYERTLSDVNQLNYRLDRWTGAGTSNTVPRATAEASGNTVFSDFYVEDGSYLRIQTAQIGYKLPSELLQKMKLDGLRFYLKGNNLATFTDYMGYDPASISGAPIGSGFDAGVYPQPKTILIGASLKF